MTTASETQSSRKERGPPPATEDGRETSPERGGGLERDFDVRSATRRFTETSGTKTIELCLRRNPPTPLPNL